MRRPSVDLRVLIGAGALALMTCAAAAPASAPPAVKVGSGGALGAKIVVDGAGRTLYRFTLDRKTSVRCTGSCARTWPPVIVSRGTTPAAGKGILRARLGTIARPDGRLQLTYAGFPVYRFAQDRKAGDTKGQALGGTWFAVAPTGRLVKQAPVGSDPGGTTPTPTTPDPTEPEPYGYEGGRTADHAVARLSRSRTR